MKIRHKLSLYFSVTGITILLLFGIAIYVFSANHRKQEFYNQLSQRVTITEQMFLEKDSFTASEFAKIKDQFLHTLPGETEDVFEINDHAIEFGEYTYPDAFIQKILRDSIGHFEDGNRQGVGKYFHLNGGDYAVIVAATDETGTEMLAYLKGIIIVTLVICILLFSLLSIPLSARIIRPLSYKIKMANMISANNLHQRLTGITSKDEIGELAIAFNKLLDRIESAFDAKKSFISNASHEIRNPLTAIMNEADIALEKQRTGEEYKESLKSISIETERIKLLVDNLLELSKINYAETPFQFEYISLIPLVESTINKYSFSSKKNKITLAVLNKQDGFNPGIWGNKNLLMSALINIIDNACKFSNEDEVTIGISTEQENVVITITDKGIGIPREDLLKVTEPFYRSSNVLNIKGSGIGITLAQRIVEIHQGKLSITSTINVGTEVKITLPLEEHLKS